MEEWQLEARRILELHRARIKTHGEAKAGRPIRGKKKGWGIRDTAKELDRPLGPTSEDIKLALCFESHPEVLKIKDRHIALEYIKRNYGKRRTADGTKC